MPTRPPTVVAAFDLDGTLTEGGSVLQLVGFIAGNARVWRAALAPAPDRSPGARS